MKDGQSSKRDYDKSIHSNPDAQAWAKFFIKSMGENNWTIKDIDESLMITWFANAMMAMSDSIHQTKSVIPNDMLNSSEALFGFCGWLTTRDEQTIMSAKDDAAEIAELIQEFIKANDLPEVRGDWGKNLTHPTGHKKNKRSIMKTKVKPREIIRLYMWMLVWFVIGVLIVILVGELSDMVDQELFDRIYRQ